MCSSIDSLKESPVLAVTMCLYACLISKEFAYAQIDSRRFEISQHYCLKQPYPFLAFTLQARHIRACFEFPGMLCPLHSHSSLIWESHNIQHGAGLFSLLLCLSGTFSAISSSLDVSRGPMLTMVTVIAFRCCGILLR